MFNKFHDDMIVDLFAGGGGVSTGIERALGRSPDVAINHSGPALAMHRANHPNTLHLQTDIWAVDPYSVFPQRRIGLLWASPDCKHHSKARGGKPKDSNIRDLAWVVVDWAEKRKPKVIFLENVEEFTTWGPIDNDGKAIEEFAGIEFERFVRRLKQAGYKVEWKERRFCDFGDPTIRKRLILIARCDGQKIVWPKPSHGPADSLGVKQGKLLPYRTASEIIDPSIPCPSIFASREEIWNEYGVRAIRPLAPNTYSRVFAGLDKYVLNAEKPCFLTYAQHGGAIRNPDEPIHTITASRKDQNAVVFPKYECADKVAAFMAQHNTGVVGHSLDKPVSTLTQRCTQQTLVAAHMMSLKGSDRSAYEMDRPVNALCAGGGHAAMVAAYMVKYYGTSKAQSLNEPLHTVTVKDRFGLVCVTFGGEPYVIVDIGMRMLTARELFRAQGFDDDYIIDPIFEGKPLTKSMQTSCVGNSVPPGGVDAHIVANCGWLAVQDREVA
ncbi:DNA cytosine methyltransferase [Lentilitoribacter sp. EG35]|uniref:DNA cytosine methyltransferase n=1 Tax=Lentilitoribacter sp. EG35 TaxID=3234192 RepID=UPI003461408A